MRVSTAFFSSHAAAAAASIWRVTSAMTRRLSDGAADAALFAVRGFSAAFGLRLVVVFFLPAVLVDACFAAVLPLDFLLGPAISSPE
jgi:hypothetical protein